MTIRSSNPGLPTAVRNRFCSEFGAEPRVFFAPGRVNLVGAHLDYNGGDVLPMAVDRGVCVAAARTNQPGLRLRSLDQELAVDVPLGGVGEIGAAERGWANFPLGVWSTLVAGRDIDHGVDLVFGGDLPMASGLSSSAAIEVATAVALDRLFGWGEGAESLALAAHRAETEYVGLQCGIMDQFASALCRPEHVLLLHCREQTFEHVPFDPNACRVLVMDTKKPRELAATRFNERVEECRQACQRLQSVREEPCLASYKPADMEAPHGLKGVLQRRARHVVTEMGRVERAVAALWSGDLGALGAALNESHLSSSCDYEVSCAELDAITAAAREVEGVFGARLTGAGFGGCAIALVRPDRVEAVEEHVARSFRDQFGVQPGFDLLRAGPGVREVTSFAAGER